MSEITDLASMLATQYNIQITQPELFKEAFTQGNYLNEHPEETGRDYQRLEFLGDSVMQLQVADYLFEKFPNWHEGQLTEMRIAMVQTKSFAHFARQVHLNEYIRLGKGEEQSGARDRDSLLEDIWEAFIGALYIDQGADVVRNFLEQTIFAEVDTGFFDQFIDYKSRLQEKVQRAGSVQIDYETIEENIQPDRTTEFVVELSIEGQVIATGRGKSIKDAEKDAARRGFQELT